MDDQSTTNQAHSVGDSTPMSVQQSDAGNIMRKDGLKILGIGLVLVLFVLGLFGYLFTVYGDDIVASLANSVNGVDSLFQEEEPVQNTTVIQEIPAKPDPTPQEQSAPVVTQPSCTDYKIYGGEFASDKCYTAQDLKDLKFYISAYNKAVFDQKGASNQADVTCDGFTDEFKKLCKEAQDEYDGASKKIAEYSGIIKGIISRGL